MDFLIPHVANIDLSDDNIVKRADLNQVSQMDEEMEEDDEDEEDEEEIERHELDDEEYDHDEEHEDEDEDDAHKTQNQHTDGHESETSSAEETTKDKVKEKVDRRRKIAAKAEETHEEEEEEHDQQGGNQTGAGAGRGRRIARNRRATKRYLESTLYGGRKKDRSEEKRPRLSVESKKSTNSPALEEYDKRKSLPNKRVEVKLLKTKLNESTPAVMPKKFKSELAIKKALAEKARISALNKAEKSQALKEKTEKSASVTDSSATTPEPTATTKKSVNRATQCDCQVPKTMDEQFLDTVRPQMELMNSRQKFNFKKRVFQALMDVFDDATNFPNKDEVIDLPATGAPRFDNTSVGELRLMRELVHLVQAAKLTPEIMNATEKATLSLDDSGSSATPGLPEKTEKNSSLTTVVVSNEHKTSSPNLASTKRNEPLGLPRHILQKVVKVAGSNGGTILAHEGEKRRVYRIYPKGTLPPNVANASNPSSTSIGTFYVTPPKTTTAATSNQTKITAQSGNSTNTTTTKQMIYNGKANNSISNTITLPTQPPPLQPNPKNMSANSVTTARHKITVRTPSGLMIQKQMVPNSTQSATNSGMPALQNKNISSTNAPKSSGSATIIRTVTQQQQQQQQVTWEDHDKPSPSSGLAQIQISQPISLNAAANSSVGSGVKAYLESAAENNLNPGESSPNTILPDGGMADEGETAGIITSDGYDPLFIKNLIKDEPTE